MWAYKIKSYLTQLILSIDPIVVCGILLIVAIVGNAYISIKYPSDTPNDVLQNQRIEQLEKRIEVLEHEQR